MIGRAFTISFVILFSIENAHGMSLSLTGNAADNTALIFSTLQSGTSAQLPAGTFPINNILFPVDYGTITGAGMPEFNGATLVGGTVLVGGTLNMMEKRKITIENLGIIVNGKDAIRSGASGNFGDLRCSVRNVSALGSGTNHGLSFTSGNFNRAENFKAYDFDHILVFRSSYNTAVNVWGENSRLTLLTIKATIDTQQDATNNLAIMSGVGGNITLDARDGYAARDNVVYASITNPSTKSGVLVRKLNGGIIERNNIVVDVAFNAAEDEQCYAIKAKNGNIITFCL